MKNRLYLILILLSFIFISLNCGSSSSSTKDYEEDSDDVTFTSNDLEKIVKHMSSSITDSAFYKEYMALDKEERALFILAPKLQNKTTQHIDSRGIIEKIRTKLINNAGIRFIDEQSIDEAMKQLQLQTSDFFDNSKALKLGNLVGGRYLLRGSMREIYKRTDLKDKVYFIITLWIVDLETTEIIWTDEKEYKRAKEKDKYRL